MVAPALYVDWLVTCFEKGRESGVAQGRAEEPAEFSSVQAKAIELKQSQTAFFKGTLK